MNLAAVAPRGAPADSRLLEKFDLKAAACQMQRGRAAGKAAANNADIASMFALERQGGNGVRHARGIVGGRVHGARSERIDVFTAWHGTGFRAATRDRLMAAPKV